MRMGIGLGIGINRSNYAQGIFNAYQSRVTADGGVTEAGACVDAVSGLLLTASLLLIPSGYKSGKAYAQIPTNGNGDLTWTRASDAWRTNADGLIQRVPWNLLQRSEEFDNAAWAKFTTTVTANAEIAPNATMTADTMTVSTTDSRVEQTTTLGAGTYTFSAYVKIISQTTAGTMRLQGFVDGAGVSVIFTPTTEWQRFTATYTAAATLTSLRVRGQAFVGTLAIWGAQLVEGSSAQTYFPTTDRLNVPRLSYMYGSCPALLLEPQRTNLVVYSEDFGNATWTKSASSITSNSTTAPDGNITADTFVGDGSSALHRLSIGLSVTTGSNYTLTIYAKKNTNNFIQIVGGFDAFGSNVWANYNLDTGVVGSIGSSSTASIQSVGNGWYRCILTGLSTATTSVLPYQIVLISSATSLRAESNSLATSVFVWGAQLELGAYPTTYIPTTTASATRVADSFSRNNIYTNGLITSSGGTWFVELRGNIDLIGDAGGDAVLLGVTTSISDNCFRLACATGSANKISIAKRIGGTTTVLYTTTTTTTKIAIKWNGSTADVFVNGTKQVSATSFTETQMQNLATSTTGPKFIQAMALYPSPLSDTDCTTLTTL